MENRKYYNRAVEIANHNGIDIKSFDIDGRDYDIDCVVNNYIEAMCDLAEEVEYNTIQKELGLYYTKEQVEELLSKQRTLCSENIKITWLSISPLQDIKDSILNAKLVF